MNRQEIDYLTKLTLKASETHSMPLQDTLKAAFEGLEVIDKHIAKDRLLNLIKEV